MLFENSVLCVQNAQCLQRLQLFRNSLYRRRRGDRAIHEQLLKDGLRILWTNPINHATAIMRNKFGAQSQ